ncbi:hypothetical protein I316_06751 [Kwoniella heveanensis BCC8398]|uniref:Zn(2)-C6 fungal-type domain-containing protein n=1 Tax=Kwoniella heveanensis BCC8398 TaxID=1296120 RepID=A0A1B9GKB8_9TREE|nr:hypothetical protein I316_06751 [Kwoniella heveanensis BCC8398]
MPAEPRTTGSNAGAPSTSAAASTTGAAASKKRSVAPKRGAIACVRCKERKAKCVPAPPGTSPVPTCTNCLSARKECVYLERTPNEIFLLEYVSQLEARCAALETELRKANPSSSYASDHIQMPAEARSAAVNKLNQVYPSNVAATAQSVKIEQKNVQSAISTPTGSDRLEAIVDGEEGDEEDLTFGIGMLSLGGGAEPVYVGPSSGINWARVCATALRRPRDRNQSSHLSRFSYLAPPEVASVQEAVEYTLHHPTPPLPSPALAQHYMDLVYDHIQARYGCFDWRMVRNWHENRHAITQERPLWGVGAGADEGRALASFFLWLCYGYGAKLSEEEKLEGAVSHEVYYNAAVACLSTLTHHHSLATVQALVMLIIYGLRHPTAEVSVWQVGGLAMRTAVELGLHRRTRSRTERERDPMRYEMKKRVFWAVYTLDRMMSAQLGRPTGIQDRDIDVELPLNVNFDFADVKALAAMQNRQLELMDGRRPGEEYSGGYGGITSMTSPIHQIRLSQLKQSITNAIYRIDKPLRPRTREASVPEDDHIPEVDQLLQQLNLWRALNPTPQRGIPMLTLEYWELEYHDCVQLLLRPVIASRKAVGRYISLCLESACTLCETQSVVLRPPVPRSKLSTWRFYRIFLAGLTILHVITTFPAVLSEHERVRAEQAIKKCQGCLTEFAHAVPSASRHEHLFIELVSAWEQAHSPESQSRLQNQAERIEVKQEAESPVHQSAIPIGTTEEMIARLFDLSSGAGTTGSIGATTNPSLPISGQSDGIESSSIGASHPNQESTSFSHIPYGQPNTGMSVASQNTASNPSTGSNTMGFESLSGGVTTENDWSSLLGGMGGGYKDDFFSIMSTLGLNADVQTPAFMNETSVPIFDFSAYPAGAGPADVPAQNWEQPPTQSQSQQGLATQGQQQQRRRGDQPQNSNDIWNVDNTPQGEATGGIGDWSGLFEGINDGQQPHDLHGTGQVHAHAHAHGQEQHQHQYQRQHLGHSHNNQHYQSSGQGWVYGGPN